jgi:hypothetical protein
VRRRWLLGERIDDDAMRSASDARPVADTGTIYEAVRRMSPVPSGSMALAAVLVPPRLR